MTNLPHDHDPVLFRLLEKFESLPILCQIPIGMLLGAGFWAIIIFFVWLAVT